MPARKVKQASLLGLSHGGGDEVVPETRRAVIESRNSNLDNALESAHSMGNRYILQRQAP